MNETHTLNDHGRLKLVTLALDLLEGSDDPRAPAARAQLQAQYQQIEDRINATALLAPEPAAAPPADPTKPPPVKVQLKTGYLSARPATNTEKE